MLEISKFALYFFIYGFGGWCCEVIYCSIIQKKLTNRGFLYSPICPIYGFGGAGMVLCFNWLTAYSYGFVIVAIGGLVLTSAIEYVTSYAMEKIFNMRWWDYSKKPFNINGRICLINSVMFMIMTLFLIYGLHPFVSDKLALVKPSWVISIATFLTCVLLMDFVFSIMRVNDFSKFLGTAEDILSSKVTEIKTKYNRTNLERSIKSFTSRFPSLQVMKDKIGLVKIKEYFAKLLNKEKGDDSDENNS